MPEADDILFFPTPAVWRRWLARYHDRKTELWVGFYKTKSGKPSITWPESVDEALCFGWIDGLRKSIDETAYKIRFTPRKPTSIWSAVNTKRVAELTEQGKMEPAGLAAFGKRTEAKSGVYSFERAAPAELTSELQRRFEKNAKAWTWFQTQAPWYRRTAIHLVMSAKKEETRLRRFEELLRVSALGERLGQLTSPKRTTTSGASEPNAKRAKPSLASAPRRRARA